jgi:hypothetical protein
MPPPTEDNPLFTGWLPLWGLMALLVCSLLAKGCEKMVGA